MNFSMSCAGILICVSGAIAQTAVNPTAERSEVPRKSVKDLIAQIEAARPQPERIAHAKALLAEPFPMQASVPEQILFLRKQGQAAEELGLTSRELDIKRRNAALARGTDSASRILFDLAVRERAFGDLSQSMALVDEVVALRPPAGMLVGAYGRMATDRAAAGDTAGADEAQKRADEAYRLAMTNPRASRWNRHAWRGQLECWRGYQLLRRGRLSDADAAFRIAVESTIEDAKTAGERLTAFPADAPTPDATEHARDACEVGWATALLQQRRHVDAEILMRAQVERVVARVGRDSPHVAGALGALGAMYLRQGRYPDSVALLREAVRILEQVGAEDGSNWVGIVRADYANALYATGSYMEAVRQVERWTGPRDRNLGAQPSYVIALTLTGKGPQALQTADEVLKRLESRYGPNHLIAGQAKGAKAMAVQAQGGKAEALTLYRDAVRILADARSRSSDSETEALDKRILEHVLEAYLGLLSDMQGPEFAPMFPIPAAHESFAVADLLRAGSVQRALAATAARASTDARLAQTVRREQDFGEEAAGLRRTLGNLLAAPPEKQLTKIIADMRSRIDVIEKEQLGLVREIERSFPAYVNLIAPKPPSLAETQGVLKSGEALLAVLAGEKRMFVWAVPKTGDPVFHASPVGARAIETLTAQLRRTVDPFSYGLADVPPFDLDNAYRIYQTVVAPVEKTLEGARHLIVSANGSLGAVPFALLPSAPSAVQLSASPTYIEYRKVPWLLRKHAITQVPSVNALVTLRALPARADASSTFAGIGDPIFSKAQLARGAESGVSVSVRGGSRIGLRSPGNLEQFDSAELGRLAALPDTGEEVRGIAALFGAQADVLLQVGANEKEVKSRDWRSKRVILFATHGLVPGELNGLDQPALALTAPDVAGVDGDGLLTVEEILNLKLDADWVVLSACNTASGSAKGAEALSGLGRAFFYAGTRALLASNWPIETTSAKLLTTGVFKRQAAQSTLSKAEALRATMLDLIDTGEAKDAAGKAAYSYAHPLFWAPFSLVGDGS